MKKYICILFALLCLLGCDEDETVDITIMPPITNTGEGTFGCLIDGWLYVGGRYHSLSYLGEEWESTGYRYDPVTNEMSFNVIVKERVKISFTILSPEEGKACVVTDIRFGAEELEDGTALISKFNQKTKIISGTFFNDERLTHGRFDVRYISNRN